MGVGSFFKLPQYNVFDYKPRFYDPKKEARDQRRKELRNESGKSPAIEIGDEYVPGSSIKGSFRPKMPRQSYRSRSSTIRLIVIMAALFLLAYILLATDFTSVIKFFSR